MQINHLLQVVNTPPEGVLGTNAGTGIAAKIDIKGDDTYGIITINTGDNPYGENICNITFQKPYATDGLIIEFHPYNRQAKDAPNKPAAEAEANTGFEVNCTGELNDNDVYQWTYKVTEILSA